jgi:D-alanyl-D-alanine dipeptidase
MPLLTDPEQIEREYARIESTFAKLSDLIKIPTVDSDEKLIAIDPSRGIISGYKGKVDMRSILGGIIYVREGVYERLLQAHQELRGLNSDLTFDVHYGYRLYETQVGYFEKALARVKAYNLEHACGWSDEEIHDRAHWYAAFPEIAGHPTGGAIDLVLHNKRLAGPVDMGMGGVSAGPLIRKIYFASPEIDDEAAENRMILRTSMESAGFHGFAGEYWHHSYGDREWAFHTGASNAIYAPLSLIEAEKIIA